MVKTGAARARPLKLVTKGALKMHTTIDTRNRPPQRPLSNRPFLVHDVRFPMETAQGILSAAPWRPLMRGYGNTPHEPAR
ncbi:hypothetical protein NDU88_004084 [Pleurodeles waltl]|uniref:Uncharacterized protein n=1 Tax=Pleurodeles waltl TaxID=8319 RepID=A0AAV7LHI7_PLEWA|nr:hypothetical protein NDU88_004084 [Pleurodeles waltl]